MTPQGNKNPWGTLDSSVGGRQPQLVPALQTAARAQEQRRKQSGGTYAMFNGFCSVGSFLFCIIMSQNVNNCHKVHLFPGRVCKGMRESSDCGTNDATWRGTSWGWGTRDRTGFGGVWKLRPCPCKFKHILKKNFYSLLHVLWSREMGRLGEGTGRDRLPVMGGTSHGAERHSVGNTAVTRHQGWEVGRCGHGRITVLSTGS